MQSQQLVLSYHPPEPELHTRASLILVILPMHGQRLAGRAQRFNHLERRLAKLHPLLIQPVGTTLTALATVLPLVTLPLQRLRPVVVRPRQERGVRQPKRNAVVQLRPELAAVDQPFPRSTFVKLK